MAAAWSRRPAAAARARPCVRAAEKVRASKAARPRGTAGCRIAAAMSQKARSTQIFRTEYAVVNLCDLEEWDNKETISPESLVAAGLVTKRKDGVKILAAGDAPQGLKFRDVAFSAPARAEARGRRRDLLRND